MFKRTNRMREVHPGLTLWIQDVPMLEAAGTVLYIPGLSGV